MAVWEQEPVKVSLTNLQTDETVYAQFNPETFTPGVEAEYVRKAVLGQSHRPLQYTGTGNLQFSMEFEFNLLASGGPINRLDPATAGYAANQNLASDHLGVLVSIQNFLWSLLYADIDEDDPHSGEPPDVLVIWPKTLSAVCKLISIQDEKKQFSPDGSCIRFCCKCTFEENRKLRLLQSSVRRQGLLRAKNEGE